MSEREDRRLVVVEKEWEGCEGGRAPNPVGRTSGFNADMIEEGKKE